MCRVTLLNEKERLHTQINKHTDIAYTHTCVCVNDIHVFEYTHTHTHTHTQYEALQLKIGKILKNGIVSVIFLNMSVLRLQTLYSSTFLKIFLEYILYKSPFGTFVSIYSLTKRLVAQAAESRIL